MGVVKISWAVTHRKEGTGLYGLDWSPEGQHCLWGVRAITDLGKARGWQDPQAEGWVRVVSDQMRGVRQWSQDRSRLGMGCSCSLEGRGSVAFQAEVAQGRERSWIKKVGWSMSSPNGRD